MEQKKYRIEPLLWPTNTIELLSLKNCPAFVDGVLRDGIDVTKMLASDPSSVKCEWYYRQRCAGEYVRGALPSYCASNLYDMLAPFNVCKNDIIDLNVFAYGKNRMSVQVVTDCSVYGFLPFIACVEKTDELKAFCKSLKEVLSRGKSKSPEFKSLKKRETIYSIILTNCKGLNKHEVLTWVSDHIHLFYNKWKMSEMDRYDWNNGIVLKIDRPEIRRETGNTNKKTFDFVRVEMSIRSTYQSVEKLKEHKKEIIQKALDKIDNYKPYQKYGVPVKYLHLYRMTLLQCGDLILDFEVPKATDILKGETNEN